MTGALMLAGLLSASQLVPAEPVYITFGSPVCLPGATLPPGTYVFAAGRSLAGQAVIDVYRAAPMEIVTSALALETSVPDRPPAATHVDYRATSPPCLRAWFPLGAGSGYTFVYAPDEAEAIHARSGEPVPAAAFRGGRPRAGVVAIEHLDDRYVAGRRDAVDAGTGEAGGPIEELTLARVTLLAHLHDVPPDIAARLRLLNAQIAALTASYMTGDGRAPELLRLTGATLDNSVFDDPESVHVIERVRERIIQFAAALR